MGVEIALRFVLYSATLLLFGASLFLVYAPDRIKRKPAVRVRSAATVAALISDAAILVVHTAVVSGGSLLGVLLDGTLLTAIRETTFGRTGALRLVLLMLLAFAEVPRAAVGRAVIAGAIIASIAWSGHAIGTPGTVHVLTDATHLLAAGAWVGGLIPLAWALRSETGDAGSALTSRFSQMGVVCVTALLITGWLNAWFLVGGLHALFGTTYGRLLCVKLALFLVMLVVATINRLTLAPQLPRASARRQIAANATLEVALALLIILIVAALGVMVPGAHEAMHPH